MYNSGALQIFVLQNIGLSYFLSVCKSLMAASVYMNKSMLRNMVRTSKYKRKEKRIA